MATMFTSFTFINHSPHPVEQRMFSNKKDEPLEQRCPPTGLQFVGPLDRVACLPNVDNQVCVEVEVWTPLGFRTGFLDAPPLLYFNTLQADLLPDLTLILMGTYGA